jgi:hypothetical protein
MFFFLLSIRSKYVRRIEYDQILSEHHTKLRQTQEYPSESALIWNDVNRRARCLH